MDFKKKSRFVVKYQSFNWLFLLLLACFLAGCMSAAKSHQSKENFLNRVYLNEIKPELQKQEEARDIQIPVEKALELSAMQDENLNLIRLGWKKNRLDLKQTRSLLFPRIQLQVYNETYYSNTEKKIKDNIDGGLMLQYNFLNLLFQGGQISIKKAALQSSLIKGRIEIRNLFYRLLLLLMEIDYNLREVELGKKLLKYSKDGLTLSQKLAKEGRIHPRDTWTWNHTIYDAREGYEEAKNRLEFSQRKLKYLMGKSNRAKIEVLNKEKYIPQINPNDHLNHKLPDIISESWKKRMEVKLEGINLFMSEMKLVKSKLSWLNYFRISLGFGRFFIYRDDDRANVSLSTSIVLPIFDMGDAKRKRKKAEIDRDMSRTRITNLARNISREAREAVEKVRMLKSRAINIKKMAKQLEQQKQIIKRSIKMNRAEALDLYLARISYLNVRLQTIQACLAFNKAILQLKKIRGTLLSPLLEEKIINKMLGKK
jgi:outer membrane protein TolC